ncbi:ETC complex I subunit conserved region-domain-containing protein [Cantharellus anzutake]|uniref:ETC complex I subunit conserved region-domain-containing protein n=1 Tax=Cantharellus anzutake TaxID=1750568 RepID=UPI0019032CE2|nr:ETC complex I subunit conserved region-domain-containing protein [Cantharellus anzutake]KAF8332351.1 ETC complex I subunit conserved region-domain-containing protein [Cantharellus anzutake]
MLRVFRPLRQATKLTTGIVGLEVHPNPVPTLAQTYRSTLALVRRGIPETAVYRQSVEASTEHKLSIVEAAKGDVSRVEKEIGQGQIEELIVAAEKELSLAEKMIEWKPWEPLEEKPVPGQWEYFN